MKLVVRSCARAAVSLLQRGLAALVALNLMIRGERIVLLCASFGEGWLCFLEINPQKPPTLP